jgi:hypothetical protein
VNQINNIDVTEIKDSFYEQLLYFDLDEGQDPSDLDECNLRC